MFEQPKLLRRPLPPKLLPELSMPRNKNYKDRIPRKHQHRLITRTNDEDRKLFPSSYFNGQTQLKPKDAHLLDQNASGQTQVQPKDAHGLLDQNLKKDLTLTALYHYAPASCPLQKDDKSSDMEVLAPPVKSDSVYWSFPDIDTVASTTDKDRITLSGYYSSGQTSVRLKVQNLLPDQILKKDFIITPTPSGPPGFPLHKHRRSFHMQFLGLRKDEPPYFTFPGFTFESLATESSFHPSPLMSPFRTPVVSRCNYQKLTSQLPNEVRKNIQTEVNTVILSNNDEFPVISQRKPERQTTIEMALEEKMRKADSPEQNLEDDGEGKKSVMDSLKLYAHGQTKKVSYGESDHALDDNTIKGIQGFGYQNSSEQDEQEELMAKSRMAVMFCAMHRRTELSLKAYFLTLLPDLTPLVNTLVYLNLSFNDLHYFPREVYNIKHLEVLKLRNNPIKEIPDDVHKIKTLRILNMSFNLISSLPTGLFSLPYLSYLELAYNDISVIPHEIRNLRALEYLNVEGNQLCALPCEVLNLPLKYLNMENNFMHPFLWKENSQSQPQRLTDLAALCFSRNNMWQKYTEISKDIQEILNNCTVCDCCKGPLYGQGLQLIRSCRNVFRFRRLPFLFNACSPSCYSSFMSQTDSFTRVLYGN